MGAAAIPAAMQGAVSVFQIMGRGKRGDAEQAGAAAQAEGLLAQRDIELRNARFARLQGKRAQEVAAVMAGSIRAAGRQATATGVARAAASGLSTTVGTVATALTGAEVGAEIDSDRAYLQGAMQAWGLEMEALGHEAQAENYRQAATSTIQGGLMAREASRFDAAAMGVQAAGQFVSAAYGPGGFAR